MKEETDLNINKLKYTDQSELDLEALQSIGFESFENNLVFPTNMKAFSPKKWESEFNKENNEKIIIIKDEIGNKRGVITLQDAETIQVMKVYKRIEIGYGESSYGDYASTIEAYDIKNTFRKTFGVVMMDDIKRHKQSRDAFKQARVYLDKAFPMWEDYNAYWDVKLLSTVKKPVTIKEKIGSVIGRSK